MGFDAGLQKAVSGVGEAGGSGIGNDANGEPFSGLFDELWNTTLFVVLVEGDEGLFDLVVIEQPAGVAGVFAGDEIAAMEIVEGAEGQVREVSDGGGDEYHPRIFVGGSHG